MKLAQLTKLAGALAFGAAMLATDAARADEPEDPATQPQPNDPNADPFGKFKYDPNAQPTPSGQSGGMPVDPPSGPGAQGVDNSGPAGGELVDERSAPPPSSPSEESDDNTLGGWILGIGVAFAIAAAPLAAKMEEANRTGRRLAYWANVWEDEGHDLGFVVGYGLAKAEKDERDYAIATGVVAGVGGALLIGGIITLIVQGDLFGKSWVKGAAPSSFNVGKATVTPTSGPTGNGAGVDVMF